MDNNIKKILSRRNWFDDIVGGFLLGIAYTIPVIVFIALVAYIIYMY